MAEIPLSENELAALHELDTAQPRPKPWLVSLQQQLARWERLVQTLEGTGYGLGDDDYTNELYNREGLESLMGKAPVLRRTLDRALAPLDERFKQATLELHFPLAGTWKKGGPVPPDEVHWWWFRYPKRHSRQLDSDERFDELRFLDR